MIIDSLANAGKYDFGGAFASAIEFAAKLRSDTPAGRHDITGSVYANVMDNETGTEMPLVYEVHRIYADLHIVFSGEEGIWYEPADGLEVSQAYDAGGDYAFLKFPGDGTAVRCALKPGRFALMLPQDAHMGGYALGKPGKIRKAVIKIPVTELKF